MAAACSGVEQVAGPQQSEARVNVISTSSIVGDWARHVGGEGVRVIDLLPAGADPHTFQPGARDVANVADADLVLTVGLNLEGQWLQELITNVERTGTVQLALGPLVDPIVAGDGEEIGVNNEGEMDPHFWMDPLRAKMAVSEIAKKLAEIDEGHADEYRRNAAAYGNDLEDLHSWIEARLEAVSPEDRVLVTSHDSLGYFANGYGFRVLGAIIPGVSTERDPSAREMADLVDVIRRNRVKAIFVEASVSDRMARRISEETGVPIVEGILVGNLGPAGSETDTYEKFMRRNVEIIAEALK